LIGIGLRLGVYVRLPLHKEQNLKQKCVGARAMGAHRRRRRRRCVPPPHLACASHFDQTCSSSPQTFSADPLSRQDKMLYLLFVYLELPTMGHYQVYSNQVLII